MKDSSDEIREAIEALGRGRTTRIPDALRKRVIRYAQRERGRGRVWREIAQAVGLSTSVLSRWTQGKAERIRSKGVRATLAPVRVRPDAGGTVAIVSPNGFRTDGLSIEQAAALLAQLG